MYVAFVLRLSSDPARRPYPSSLPLRGNVQTLSTTNASPGNDLTGLLYLPELDPGDSCLSLIPKYVPENVTSQINLPLNGQLAFLAIAPWISVPCTIQFLQAAHDDPLRAFVFYLPDNGTSPPPPEDPAWSLNDGGRWRSWAKFPVYAISGMDGFCTLMQSTWPATRAIFTNVPYGHSLADEYAPDYTTFVWRAPSQLVSVFCSFGCPSNTAQKEGTIFRACGCFY